MIISSHSKEEEMYPYEFFESLGKKFRPYLNENAKEKFINDPVFQKEFKFEPGERILYVNYQNIKFVIINTIIITFLMIFIVGGAMVFYVGLQYNEVISTISKYAIGILGGIFFISVLISLISGYIMAVSYRYIITDKRIIIGYTFMQRLARVIMFESVLDIIVKQGLIARFFNCGDLYFMTGSNEGGWTAATGTQSSNAKQNAANLLKLRGMRNIKNPFMIKKLVRRIMDYYSKSEKYKPILLIPEIKDVKIDYPEIDLLKDEKVYKIYKRKKSSSFFMILFGYFSIMVMLLPNLAPLFMEDLKMYVAIMVIIVIGGLFFILLISKFHSRSFVYIVTNRRIIIFKKFITTRIRDAIMGKISEISLFQMTTGRIANFGNIKIGTKGFENSAIYQTLIAITGIKDAPKEKDEILQIVKYFQKGQMYNPLIELYDPEYLFN